MVSYGIGIHNEKVFDVHISSILRGVLVGAGSFLVHYGQVRILTMPHKMVVMGERLCVKPPFLQ
jgi:uncharacterized membrane protein YadS